MSALYPDRDDQARVDQLFWQIIYSSFPADVRFKLGLQASMMATDVRITLDDIHPSDRARFENDQDDYGDNDNHSRKV